MSNEHKVTESEIKEVWERLTSNEASVKSAHHRIDNLEKLADSVNNLALSTSQIASETKALREDYNKADAELQELKDKPIRRYETFVTAVITTLCGGIIGYLVSLVLN